MRRIALAALALTLLLASAACGPATETTDAPSTQAPSASGSLVGSPTPGTPSPSVNSAADAYCAGVDEYIRVAKKALENPLQADTRLLRQEVQDLQQQAAQLAAQLLGDPDAIEQVRACTQRLKDFNNG